MEIISNDSNRLYRRLQTSRIISRPVNKLSLISHIIIFTRRCFTLVKVEICLGVSFILKI